MKTIHVVILICLLAMEAFASDILKIVAVGDIMAHGSNIKAAEKDGKYSFREVFLGVEDILKQGDLTIGNLETRFAGKDRGYTGYPAFNCPEDLARDLASVGFNYLVTANNHSLDRGYTGIIATNNILRKYGLLYTGTFSTPEEAKKISIFDNNGFRIAILNYTYGTNGVVLPKGREYMVNYIDQKKMKKEIKIAESISDYVIVFLHFGNEYELGKPNTGQVNLVNNLFASGADIILGSHPHVVQKTEEKIIKYNGMPKKVFIAYSMGNFVSGQSAKNTDIGQIAKITIQKSAKNAKAVLINTKTIKTRCKRGTFEGRFGYRIIKEI